MMNKTNTGGDHSPMRQQQLLFENKVSKSTPNLLRRAKKSDIMFARTGNK
jgi:hypothetical protein